ncbi:MAG: ABC transporter ATP-binding protein [Flavobacteriales bacterium]
MGILFILLANVFNVYAPVIIGDGIDFLAESIKGVQEIKSTGKDVQVDTPGSFQLLDFITGGIDKKTTLHASDYASTITRIALILALAYIVFFVIKGIFLFFQRQTIIVMSRYIEYDLKNEIYEQYQKLDASFYKRNRTGDLMNRISEDVNRVRMYLGPAVMYTINLLILVVMCVTVMIRIDSELTFYTLSPLPFMLIMIFYVSTIINRRTDRVQKQQSKLSTMVQETISGIRVLKAFSREKYFTNEFDKESDDYKAKQLELVKADALLMPVIAILVGVSTILTVYIGANKVIEGKLTYGVIVQFIFYVNQLTWPFVAVGWVTSLVQKAEASQKRINEFLHTKPEIKNTEPNEHSVYGEVEFKDVSFTYPDTNVAALKNVSFKVEKGKRLGIVGRTGSGKSTVAQLVLRLFDPSNGKVLIDGVDVKKLNLHSIRENIGYVPQEVFLFSESIKNNIAFGVNELSEVETEQAAKDADVYDNIVEFPNKFETLLGERGINLSGGQKQRVSIARAIAKNPSILIFDDCLSAVDTETEEHILQALDRIMEGKTSLIISHRISSIKNADHIIVLDEGRVIESGNHTELLAAGGSYAKMYDRQLKMEASD